MKIKDTKKKVVSKKPLKLFVWEGVLTDWTSGMAFAIARTKEEAANLAIKGLRNDEMFCEYSLAELLESPCSEFKLNKPIGAHVHGGG
jgi:hypothetical protein